MKRAITILGSVLLGAGLFQSCTISDEVVDQQIFTAEVFEVAVDLVPENNFSQLVNFSEPSYQGDMVLMYILWEVDGNQDVWRLVPQQVDLGNGDYITYNYDFTRRNFRIFLDSNFSLDQLTNSEINAYGVDQIFRVVVVPGGLMQTASTSSTPSQSVDFSDYEATMKYYGLSEQNVQKLN